MILVKGTKMNIQTKKRWINRRFAVFAGLLVAVFVTLQSAQLVQAANYGYTFDTDTIGVPAARTQAVAGSSAVENDPTLGKSLGSVTRSMTATGTPATVTRLNDVPYTTVNTQIQWRTAMTDTNNVWGVGIRQNTQQEGYYLSFYGATSQLPQYRNKVVLASFLNGRMTVLAEANWTQDSDHYYRVTMIGTYLVLEESSNGSTFNQLLAYFDVLATHPSGTAVFTDAWSIASLDAIHIDQVAIGTAETAINIESPRNYQVIQRDGNNQASINIDGYFTGSPTAIEARWNGGPWQVIDPSPSGEQYSGTLTGQATGQGSLEVRAIGTGATSSVQYVGIGDVYVIAGQSNASGYALPVESSHPTIKAGLYTNGDVWMEMNANSDTSYQQRDPVSGEYPSGSVWDVVGTRIMETENIPVAFIPTSLGGSEISQWAPNNSRDTLYGSMKRRINEVGGVKAVLWWQGETDAMRGHDKAYYRERLDTLAQAIRNDFNVPLVTAVMGEYQYGDQTWQTYIDQIREAQYEAWAGNPNILPGATAYDVDFADEGGDGAHYRSEADVRTLAERWWLALQDDFYGGAVARGPIMTQLRQSDDGTKIVISYDKDLRGNDGDTYDVTAFTVRDRNGQDQTISSATRTSARQITLTLANPMSDLATVWFGRADTANAKVIPRGITTASLPAELFYARVASLVDTEQPPTNPANPTLPTSPTPRAPDTGIASNTPIYILLTTVVATGIGILLIGSVRKRSHRY